MSTLSRINSNSEEHVHAQAWFVSNCDSASKRELYVAQLKKYVDVDVYGRCGDRTCWAGDQEACYAHLERHYKFYLSFENSLCRDYVTEKFFQVTLN